MIRNGELVHDAAQSRFWSANFDSRVLDSLALAAITTIISYQAVSILFDLCLGWKPRLRIKVSDLQVLHLVRESSPLAVAANVFYNPILLARRFRINAQRLPTPTHPIVRLRFIVLVKLLFLFAISPIINTASVLMTVEKDKVVSIADAKFGGLSCGINDNLEIVKNYVPYSENCDLYRVQYLRDNQVPMSDFIICTFWQEVRLPKAEDIAYLAMANMSGFSLALYLFLRDSTMFFAKTSSINVNGKVMAIPINVSKIAVEAYFDFAIGALAQECEENEPQVLDLRDRFGERFPLYINKTLAARGVRCKKTQEGSMRRLGEVLQKPVTFRQEEKFMVIKGAEILRENDLSDISDEPLFQERRHLMPLMVSSLLAVSLIVARIVLMFILHSDADIGLEAITRQGLGVDCFRSLLRNGDADVYYRPGEEICVRLSP